jgi:hypothetical protein
MSTTVSPYVTVPQEVAMTYVQEHVTSLSQSTLDLDDLVQLPFAHQEET